MSVIPLVATWRTISPAAAWRTIRYTMVGAVSAVTYNALMILGDRAGFGYLAMSVVTFAVVTPLGYLMQSRFTFRQPLSAARFLRFASGVAAGVPIYFVTIGLLCGGLGVPVIIAAPVTTVVLYVWNYASAHWAIGRRLRGT
jgi:putative flippase GtrA